MARTKTHSIIDAKDIRDALYGKPVKSRQQKAREAVEKTWEQLSLVFCFDVKPEEVYFADCSSMKELKERYKELALLHHPDRGGNTATMAAINAEYDEKARQLAEKATPEDIGEKTAKAENMTDEEIVAAIAAEFKAVMEGLTKIDLTGVAVELIGSWLWLYGDTKRIKEELKDIGFKWGFKKKVWVWHDSYTKYSSSRGGMDKEDIEDKYGKRVLKSA